MAGKVTFTGIAANYMVTIPDGKTARVAGGSSVSLPGTATTVTTVSTVTPVTYVTNPRTESAYVAGEGCGCICPPGAATVTLVSIAITTVTPVSAVGYSGQHHLFAWIKDTGEIPGRSQRAKTKTSALAGH